jgi:hypothetical protein
MQVVQMLRGEWPTYLANRAVQKQSNVRLTAGRVAPSGRGGAAAS